MLLAPEMISTVKKKKVRVALRKNRQNRTRANDLTRKFRDDELTPAAEPAVDRVRPKGELSRHRTIIEEVAEENEPDAKHANADASARRAVDTSTCLRGRVVRVHGLLSMVLADDGRTYSCHVRRLLKTLAIEGRSVVTVGDHVWFRPGSAAGSDGLIEKVEARRGVITRGYRHRQHIIAANVDQVLIVSALAEPGLKLGLIDRYLVSAEMGGVRAVIVLNKADLVDLAACQWVIGLYAQLGYETVVTSVADGRGSGRLRDLLSHGVTAVTGQSGVGKSSLLNVVQPGLEPEGPRGIGLDLQGKAHDHDRRADRPGNRRLRRGHARPPPVRALGRCSGRARGPFRRVPPLHPSLPVPRLLAHPRNRLRRQGRRLLGPDPPRTVRELSQALRAAAPRYGIR